MLTNTCELFSVSQVNKNFSAVAHFVDEKGKAVILKNSKPRYLLIALNRLREDELNALTKRIEEENP